MNLLLDKIIGPTKSNEEKNYKCLTSLGNMVNEKKSELVEISDNMFRLIFYFPMSVALLFVFFTLRWVIITEELGLWYLPYLSVGIALIILVLLIEGVGLTLKRAVFAKKR